MMSSGDYLKEHECEMCEKLAQHIKFLAEDKEYWNKEWLKKCEEVEQLKETLRKCLPCGDGSLEPCHFCNEFEHKPDCEYIELTK